MSDDSKPRLRLVIDDDANSTEVTISVPETGVNGYRTPAERQAANLRARAERIEAMQGVLEWCAELLDNQNPVPERVQRWDDLGRPGLRQKT